jgi:hypothetical protein
VTAQISTTTGFTQTDRAAKVNWPEFALLVLLAGFAVWMRALMPMASDTSWLITASEFFLDGKRLYVEIGETNPPASIWIYAPAVAFARFLAVKPEVAVISWIFVLMAGSFALAGAILARSGLWRWFDPFMLIASAIAVFAILPGDTFSQREHIAAMLVLPFLAATMARLRGLSIGLPLMMVAGACGGLVVVIKPHFVFALELPVLVAFVARPAWRTILSAENVIAGLVAVAYAAITFIFYPEFWHEAMRPIVAVYLPVTDRDEALLIALAPMLALAPMCGVYSGRAFIRHPAALCYMVALGFGVALVLQGKLWPYHFYPMIALGSLGAVLAVLYRPEDSAASSRGFEMPAFATRPWFSRLLIPYLITLAVLATFASLFFQHAHRDELAAAITRVKAKPSVATLSSQLSVGHPVTRMVGGRWSMTQPSLWIEGNGVDIRARKDFDKSRLAEVEAVENADLAVLLNDLRRNRPDILLALHGSEEAKLRARLLIYPGLAQELDHYKLVDTVAVGRGLSDVDIYARQDAKPDSQ